jgi:hypothetical protein
LDAIFNQEKYENKSSTKKKEKVVEEKSIETE